MDSIKNNFSIRDLENLTGIKAHTIRIWEKRYDLLKPNRSKTNIRYYNSESLVKLLNIKYLNENGYKISKIALLNSVELTNNVKTLESNIRIENKPINTFKVAMVTFDKNLFNSTYDELTAKMPFKEIMFSIFIPLLKEIGVLWQLGTITPAHEHYISTFIKQKILINIERIEHTEIIKHNTFVLFLPENEIHDIGLLYIYYHLLNKGYHVVYLGENTPMESLKDVLKLFHKITFISYFTVSPSEKLICKYLEKFNNLLLKSKNTKLYLLGRKTAILSPKDLSKNITLFNSINQLMLKI